jgi:protein-disulfide isomerase
LTSRFHSANRISVVAAVRMARRNTIYLAALLIPLALGLPAALRARQSTAPPPSAGTRTAAPHAKASHPVAEKPLGPPIKSYGSSTAPIKFETFTDYQCPSCRSLFEQTLKQMIADYVSSGKVYLVHHDFPLAAHAHSGEAARWANAAARVGEFQNVEEALYDNQDAWEESGNIQRYVAASMPPADFKRVQQQMQGCDGPGPTSSPGGGFSYPPGGHPCPLDPFITADIALGQKVPVQATPTYVITYKGNRLPAASGAVSWTILKQFFDSLLAQ